MRPLCSGPTAFVVMLAAALSWLTPAGAADVIFPGASRVGLVPPPGFVADPNFPAFRHTDKAASIVVADLPEAAFAAIEKQVTSELEKEGQVPITRTEVTLKDGGTGFLLYGKPNSPQGPVLRWTLVAHVGKVTAVVTAMVPEQIQDVASDEAIRASLTSLTVREAVPAAEQLALLPFAMNDLGGFRIVRVAPGNAVVLTEGPSDIVEVAEQPLLMIAIAPWQGMQAAPNERDSVARRLFSDITTIKDMRIQRSEPLRVAGSQGHELLAEGKDAKTQADMTAVQWLRFGSGTILRMVAISRTDKWDENYARFRKVRDGIGPK